MIKLREVQDEDLLPLTEFLPRGFPFTTKDFWLHRFKMWWTANPAYTPQFPRGWVLENDSTLVGFIGNIPVKFLVRGRATCCCFFELVRGFFGAGYDQHQAFQ